MAETFLPITGKKNNELFPSQTKLALTAYLY